MNLTIILKDPFRFFFPVGWGAGVLGVGLWLPLAWGNTTGYPLQAHRLTMVGGFLLSFVVGFLATAIPRFTSSWYLRGWEFLLLFVGLFGAIYSGFTSHPTAHHLSVFMTISVLILFGVQRNWNREENPPFTFVFVAGGLVLWWTANLLLTLSPYKLIAPFLIPPANAIYNHGALFCLVIGVGGRLVPGMLGWEKIVLKQRDRYENAESLNEAIPIPVWIALAVFLFSYLAEGSIDPRVLWIVRGVVMSYVAIVYWKIYRFPKERTGFTWGIWVSIWSFILGVLVPIAWPASGSHGFHTIFIGGFSLLTILVATRVTLAHGTEGKQLESSSITLKLLIGLFVLAMVTRVTAAIWPRVYLSHLGYAAMIWLLGILLWACVFLPRMLTDFE
ncbi:MAG: NnrS family protein [bacterium]